jgi:hypothetical protein
VTLAKIRSLWRARDARYGKRRFMKIAMPLTPIEAAAVQWWRAIEVDVLVLASDRRAARAVLAKWHPPLVTN